VKLNQNISYLFYYVALFTNFLHKKRMDFTYEMIGDHIHKPLDHGWVKDNNYMSKQALSLALNFSSKINPYSHVIHKLKIFTLFLCAWLMPIFVTNDIVS
jgi:hypothetical protein